MGILNAIDSTYKGGVDSVIDNEALSVQDTVRGTVQAATGNYGNTAEDFRQDSKQFFNSVSGAMDAPAQAVNQATQGTALNNAATDALEEGGETAYEMFGEYPAAVAYGTATGSDLRGVAKEDTKTDYTPGVLDTLEIAWVGGPASKVASRGGRAVAKAAKSSDEAAQAAAGGGSSMGIISGLRKMVTKSDEAADAASDAARASDEAAGTQTTLDAQFANRARRNTERLEDATPTESALAPLREAASSRANQAVIGGTVAAGAGWSLMGGGSGGGVGGSLPDGYRVAAQVNASPGGVIVERVNSEGASMGFWAIAGKEGSDYVSVVSRGGGFGTTPVSFAGNPSPPYDSQSQARQAFRTWAQQQSSGGEPTNAENNSRQQPSSPWGEAEVVTPLDNGWYLAEQAHKTEEKYRYLVAGRGPNGSLMFVAPGGTATTSPQTYMTRDDAMSAYKAWQGTDSSTAPDPSQQRPTSSDLINALRGSGPTGSGGGGSLGLLGLLAAGGAAAALAAIVYKVVVQ